MLSLGLYRVSILLRLWLAIILRLSVRYLLPIRHRIRLTPSLRLPVLRLSHLLLINRSAIHIILHLLLNSRIQSEPADLLARLVSPRAGYLIFGVVHQPLIVNSVRLVCLDKADLKVAVYRPVDAELSELVSAVAGNLPA